MDSKVEQPRKRGKPKGSPKTGGRKAGTPNKLTTDIKAAIHEAFDQLGGVKWLVEVGRGQPQLFIPLLGKVIPTGVQVSGDPENPIVTRTEVVLVSPSHPYA